jgi:enoyl-CoA hydratase
MTATPIVPASAATDAVWIRREQRAGRITLNRPKALNALTWPMVKAITAALTAWRDDPTVHYVVLDGAGDRGLCAGGDVRWLYDIRTDGVTEANQFWREEYSLNSLIARYPKPFVAIMDGIVMGGGIGLSAHGRHRIVTERSQIAMPETTIGLVPDVGGTWLLSRAQGQLGVYLGLTGARMSGPDAIQVGFADTFVASGRLADLVARLSAQAGDAVDDIIDEMAEPVPVSGLTANRALIDQLFAGETLPAIHAALLTTTDPLATKARADLAVRSPKALALALEAIRRAKSYGRMEDALAVEFRLCTRLYEDGEFSEGVRALLIDKDKAPKWNPPDIAGVTPELIASYFAPLARDWPR